MKQFLFLLIFSVPVFAYVDPGSGSALVTAILGIIAAISYTFRKWFYALRSKIFKKK
tara:strand:+ start:430 stop:600 length:171 start_codon:yes stop_codon:yes gene_type:complete